MMGGDGERERRPGGGGRGGRGGYGGDRGDRDRGDREGGYRRRDMGDATAKEGGDAPGGFAPQFRGGFGRGRGAPPS